MGWFIFFLILFKTCGVLLWILLGLGASVAEYIYEGAQCSIRLDPNPLINGLIQHTFKINFNFVEKF